MVSPSGARRLGRFDLKRVLGKGAQATVWLGYDARLDRDVAVKLLNRDADTVAVNQWLHEARAVSRLAHPHIVPVFEADGQPAPLLSVRVDGRCHAPDGATWDGPTGRLTLHFGQAGATALLTACGLALRSFD